MKKKIISFIELSDYKIPEEEVNRAAIHLIKGNKPLARDAIGTAHCYWKRYTTIMDGMYYPVDTQRKKILTPQKRIEF